MKLRMVYLILLILVLTVIFIFSSQSGEKSQNVSDSLLSHIIGIFGINDVYVESKLLDIFGGFIRKCAHFALFMLVGIFLYLFIDTYRLKNDLKVVISGLLSMAFASLDEFHQLFALERSASILDVLLDSVGSYLGILVTILVINILKYRKKDAS